MSGESGEHLDEGTIHAWLDGALDAAESARVEAHVASCVSCQEAVAEARGFVAAASRILSALDEVPGDVIPSRAARLKPRRSIARWPLHALAAAVVVAVGLTVWHRSFTRPVVPVVPSVMPVAPSVAPASPPPSSSVAPRPRVAMTPLAAPATVTVPKVAPVARATDQMASPAVMRDSPDARLMQSDVAPASASSEAAKAVRLQNLVGPQRRYAPSAAAAGAPVPSVSHCDSLRLARARSDSQRLAGALGADSITTAQRDTAATCKK